MAFGALRGTLAGSSTSPGTGISATGSVAVTAGDLIVANYAWRGTTKVTFSDNLGNAYIQQSNDTALGNARSFVSAAYAKANGTLTSVSFAHASNTGDAAASVTVIEGPFDPWLIDAVGVCTAAGSTPYAFTATGALTQADEVIFGVQAQGNGGLDASYAAGSGYTLGGHSSTGNGSNTTSGAAQFKLVSSATGETPTGLVSSASTAGTTQHFTYRKARTASQGDCIGQFNNYVLTTPVNAVGYAVVSVGDLIYVHHEQPGSSNTSSAPTDNLGNTYSALNSGTSAASTENHIAYYSIATVAGTLTSISAAYTGAVAHSMSAAVFKGPFGALDVNATCVEDGFPSPFNAPATGTLANANELVVSWVGGGARAAKATSPGIMAAAGGWFDFCDAIQGRVVSSTSSVTPQFTVGFGDFLGTTTFTFGAAGTNINLTAVTATGQTNTFSLQITSNVSLTAAPATAGTTPFVPRVEKTLTATTATGQAATFTIRGDDSQTLTTTPATGQAATFTPAVDKPLTAVTATGQFASFTVSVASATNVNLVAVSATGQAATFTPAVDKPLTAATATGQFATFTVSIPASVNLVAVTATGQRATFTPAVDKTLTAVTATGQAATFTPAVDKPLTAAPATGQLNSFTVSVASAVNVNLTAVSATGQTATFTPAVDKPLTAAPATGQAATFTIRGDDSQSLAAVTATGQRATFTPAVDKPLTAVTATGQVATFAISVPVNINLTAVTATGQFATFSVSAAGNINFNLVAAPATGQAATFVPNVAKTLTATSATGQNASFVPNVAKTLTAAPATAQFNTFTVRGDVSINLTAVTATGQFSNFSVSTASNANVNLVAAPATGQRATFTPAADKTLTAATATGQFASFTVSVSANVNVNLVAAPATGQFATFTVSIPKSVNLTAVTATGQRATFVPNPAPSLVAAPATGQNASFTCNPAKPLTAAPATGQRGVFLVSTPSARFVPLVGRSATGQAGAFTVALSTDRRQAHSSWSTTSYWARRPVADNPTRPADEHPARPSDPTPIRRQGSG